MKQVVNFRIRRHTRLEHASGSGIRKIMLGTGNYSNPMEIKKVMMTNIAGEITDGEPDNGFLVKQGIE